MKRISPALAAAVLALLCLSSAGAEGDKAHRKGDVVKIVGRVVDSRGHLVPGVTVILELSRTSFRPLKMRRESGQNTLRMITDSNEAGQYLFEWQWDNHYNRFELVVALPVKRGAKDDFEILARRDITDLVFSGKRPVVTSVDVENTSYLEWFRAYLDDRSSEDEDRIFREMGRPQRMDTSRKGEVTESSWWYFEAGKVYRFLDGTLDEVLEFEPVKSP